jgi:uncharacterized membrane protein YhaH (DUF805 family)
MRLQTLLFSFRGRIDRAQFWRAILIYLVVLVTFEAAVMLYRHALFDPSVFAFLFVLNLLQSVIIGGGGVLLTMNQGLASVVGFLMFVSALSVGAKRLHDRDKSAWWLTILYGAVIFSVIQTAFGITSGNIPLVLMSATEVYLFFAIVVVLQAWYLIELGCLRGTAGPNRYGPDPLGPALPAASTI